MSQIPKSLRVIAARTRDALARARAPFPHQGGCPECRAERRCSYCGSADTYRHNHCTNDRCWRCHTTVCTPGGATSPGHGFGQTGGPHWHD